MNYHADIELEGEQNLYIWPGERVLPLWVKLLVNQNGEKSDTGL